MTHPETVRILAGVSLGRLRDIAMLTDRLFLCWLGVISNAGEVDQNTTLVSDNRRHIKTINRTVFNFLAVIHANGHWSFDIDQLWSIETNL